MKTIKQLEEEVKPIREEFDKKKKSLEATGRKMNKLYTKINRLKVEGVLGDEITLEGIMKLEWHLVAGKLYNEITNWCYKNVKYLLQSGYSPDAGAQPAWTIKMNRGHDVKPQIEEITRIIGLTNTLPDAKEFHHRDAPKGPYKHFGLFVSSRNDDSYDDDYSSYSFCVYEGGKVVIYRNRWAEARFDTVDEALRFIHKRFWYNDSEPKGDK